MGGRGRGQLGGTRGCLEGADRGHNTGGGGGQERGRRSSLGAGVGTLWGQR